MGTRSIRVGVNTTRSTWDYIFSEEAKRRLHELVAIDEDRIPETASVESIRSSVSNADVIIGSWGAVPLSAEIMNACPDMGLFIYGAGSIKHLLTEESAKRGVRVSTGSHVNAQAVAEYTLGMILVSLKDVFRLNGQLKAEGPDAWAVDRIGFQRGYRSSKVGLIGFGEVTRQLLRLLAHFELDVYVADPVATPADALNYRFHLTSIEKLLSTCDVVSLHAADIPANEGMLGSVELTYIKPGSTLINSARGRLINEEALVERLRVGDITAILDVSYPEPPQRGHPFYTLENCILTPHMAGSVGRESRRLGDYCVRELENWVNRRPLEHEIDVDMLPNLA